MKVQGEVQLLDLVVLERDYEPQWGLGVKRQLEVNYAEDPVVVAIETEILQ